MGRINQLAEKTTLNSTDVIAVDAGAGGNTNKMTGANLAGQLKALGNYQDKLTFDSTPTAGSTNPVTSGGVKTALDGKQNTLTFDTTPTAGSTNPVTSGGIANAIAQSTASIDYSELLVFSGTSEATVSLDKTASDFDLVNFILLDSNGVRVAAAMTTVIQAHNVTFKLYGESSSQWGSIRISDDYTKATCNRTSSNTSQLRIIGIKYR